MSIATSSNRPRARKPRLKVFGGERRAPRHRAVWGTGAGATVVEFITESEWAALAPWERSNAAAFLPGIGFVVLSGAESQSEVDEVRDEYTAEIVAWSERQAARGSGRCGD